MNCTSCDCKEVATAWVRHRFQYGPDPGVTLSTQVPMRTCLYCGEEWLDHVGEDIIAKVIANHLSTFRDEWEKAAQAAAKKADACNVSQVVQLMESEGVAIKDMDEWCQQARENYPCLFKNHVVEGLS